MNFHFFSAERIQTFLCLSSALLPSLPHFSLPQKADLYGLQQQDSKPSFSGWVWLVEALRGTWREVRRAMVIPWISHWGELQGLQFSVSLSQPNCSSQSGWFSFSLFLSLSCFQVGAPSPPLLGPRTVTVLLLFSWHPFEKGDQSRREIGGLEWIYDGRPAQGLLSHPPQRTWGHSLH